MLMDPYPSQQHAGLHNAVWRPEEEVTRPKARFKPTSPNSSGVDGGANQVHQNILKIELVPQTIDSANRKF